MKVLLAPTEDFIRKARGQVAADVAPGSGVTLVVDNGAVFALHDYIVIGIEGSDTAELVQISAITGNNLTVTIALAHKMDEPIVKYRYNKRKFYGCATQTGAFIELTAYGSPAVIDVNNPPGTSIEYSGGEGYQYFKATYFNSQTSEESNLADSNTVLANESARYCGLYQIRVQAGLAQNPNIDDGRVEEKRKQAENEVDSALISKYILPLTRSSDNVVEIPALVQRITILLAAGYLNYEEYNADGDGVKWLGEARGILNALQLGKQKLIGTDKQEMSQFTLTRGIQAYPDDSAPPAKFGMGQEF